MATNSPQTDCLTTCNAMAREQDFERWLAALLAPPAARTDLSVILAFNAEVAKTRDVVSEPMLGQIRLQWWRETIEGAALGAPRGHPVAEGLAAVLAQGRVKADDLRALIDARETDLTREGLNSLDDFLTYIDATAGALNRLLLACLGIEAAAAQGAAHHAARATAIAGQLRAAAVNAARGRVLLPRDVLAAQGVTVDALLAGRPQPGLAAAARELAEVAGREITAARALRREVPAAALPVLASLRFADHHLARLGRAGFDVFSPRIAPLPLAAPLAVLRAMLTGRY